MRLVGPLSDTILELDTKSLLKACSKEADCHPSLKGVSWPYSLANVRMLTVFLVLSY